MNRAVLPLIEGKNQFECIIKDGFVELIRTMDKAIMIKFPQEEDTNIIIETKSKSKR